VPEGANPWYEVPVFNWYQGKLTTYYVRRYIESARRFEQVPPLTPRQIAAFDAFDAVCDDAEIHLSMDFEPGDMQFLHNHQVLHDRTAFTDFAEPERRRHLLRLWLCPPDGRALPPTYAQRWGSIEPGRRGGIRVPGVQLVAPLDP
jgi:alpha-ketoglutarate-dependent taurine dioxygenase